MSTTETVGEVVDNGRSIEGLRDAEGPMPTFGPAKLDEHGRIVIDPEEWAARKAALDRLDRGIARGEVPLWRPGPTDTDEVWDRFDRALRGED